MLQGHKGPWACPAGRGGYPLDAGDEHLVDVVEDELGHAWFQGVPASVRRDPARLLDTPRWRGRQARPAAGTSVARRPVYPRRPRGRQVTAPNPPTLGRPRRSLHDAMPATAPAAPPAPPGWVPPHPHRPPHAPRLPRVSPRSPYATPPATPTP